MQGDEAREGGGREGEGEKGMLRGVIENFFPLKILRIWPLKILRIWPGRWCSGTRRGREEGGRGREGGGNKRRDGLARARARARAVGCGLWAVG